MSAPLSAYHSKALKDKTTPQNYLQCKFLAEYTSIGSHFYLDYILKFKDNGVFYFTGACIVGSAKSKYHASARKGKLFDGLEVYTDGGLNTLGFAAIQTVLASTAQNKDSDPNMHPPRINDSVIFAYFKSAYYLDSTLKLEMEIEGLPGSWYLIFSDSLAEKLDTEYKSGVIGEALSRSGNHKFRATLTNGEGSWVSESVVIDIKMAIFALNYDASFASSAKDGASVTRYSDTRNLLDAENNGSDASQLFKNEAEPLEHTDYGFYYSSIENKWYKYGYDVLLDRICILAKGNLQPGGYPPGDPANIIVDSSLISCNGFDKFDQLTANTQVLSANYNRVDIFKENKTDYEQDPPLNTITYFSDSEKTSYAQEGFYAVGEYVMGVTREIAVGPEGIEIYDNIL